MAANTRKIVDLVIKGDSRSAEASMSKLGQGMSGLQKAAVALGSALALGHLARDFVRINTEFQRLKASLETVTGSADAADLAFNNLTEFAKNTPYQLEQVIEAFTKLQAMGLDPSMESLESYGNTASAMGKSLNQMIEAVADAATGEFERLKEFGIKARQQGDQVTFTFRGVSTTVSKHAADIESYLQKIGQVEFAGGMQRQMDTLGGALSNLSDAYSQLLYKAGETSGASDTLTEAIKGLSAAISSPAFVNGLLTAATLISKIGTAAINAVSDLDQMGRAIAIARAGYGDWRDILMIPFSDAATERIIADFDSLTVQQRSVTEAIARTKEEIEDLKSSWGFFSDTDKEQVEHLKEGLAYLERQKVVIDGMAAARGVPLDSWLARDRGAISAPPVNKAGKKVVSSDDKAAAAAAAASAAAQKHIQDRIAEIRAIDDQIVAIEKYAKTWGMASDEVKLFDLEQQGATQTQIDYAKSLLDTVSGLEAQAEKQQQYKSLISDLRTEEEALADQMRERLRIMDEMAPDGDRSEIAGRIASGAISAAPETPEIAAEVGGPFGELAKIAESENLLNEWYATQLEMINGFRAERADLNETWNEQEQSLAKEHANKLMEIERAKGVAQLAATEYTFGTLADMARQFAGEQSGIHKAMFAVQKAAAIAQSIVAIQSGIAQAAANPWPMNLAAMASVAAATASIVSNIQSVGMAHDGIDKVPETGTWLLQKGERVTTEKTSARLDRTLADVKASQQQAPAPMPQNIRIVNAFDTSVVGDYLGSDAGERKIMNVIKRNPSIVKQVVS